MMKNCVALTIAGSDSGGGAGIQADLKTFSALGVYGTSVITAITAQNLKGVYAIQAIDKDVVREQLKAVLKGFPVKGIKTGMLYSSEIIDTIAEVLEDYKSISLIIDPVFAATSGSKLIQDDAIASLTEKLFPLASLITPNIPEAEFLTNQSIRTVDDLKKAAEMLYKKFNVPFLMKGGHLDDSADDVLFDSEGMIVFQGNSIKNVNNHGSGCTLSSAIAAECAKGSQLRDSVRIAKDYLYNGLKNSHNLQDGVNVIDHFWRWFR